MTYDRRGDRRSGGGRPPGGRSGGGRSDRPPRTGEGFGGSPRGSYVPRGSGGGRSFDRPAGDRGGSYAPRTRDEGGMSIRLDPRRLAALKLLAGEEGLRPGELVTRWVEERLDAARAGQPAAAAGGASIGGAGTGGALAGQLETLNRRIDELAQRLDALAVPAPAPAEPMEPAPSDVTAVAPTATKRRGRPPKAAAETRQSTSPAEGRVPLHEEIVAVISERGPMTAGELATAIKQRGRYSSPRSSKPFDASTVNARVSNPVYRSRFTRDKGRIGLANAG